MKTTKKVENLTKDLYVTLKEACSCWDDVEVTINERNIHVQQCGWLTAPIVRGVFKVTESFEKVFENVSVTETIEVEKGKAIIDVFIMKRGK